MPKINRRRPVRRDWSDLHRRQLREGADHPGQIFGLDGIRARRRGAVTGAGLDDETIAKNWNRAGTDFSAGSMALAEQAWRDLRGELLGEADGEPENIWGFRRFELQNTNHN